MLSSQLSCSFRRVKRKRSESVAILISPATFESASSLRCVTQHTASDSGDYYVGVHVDNASLATLDPSLAWWLPLILRTQPLRQPLRPAISSTSCVALPR